MTCPSMYMCNISYVDLDMVIPVEEETSLHCLIGVLLCLRSLIPHLSESAHDKQGLKGSFGVMTKEKEQTVSKEQIIKVHLHSSHSIFL